MITFQWDARKAETNQRKHGVSFEEARTVFFDEFAIQFFDYEHSAEEDRFVMLGMSSFGRILIVCHCERGRGETIRIISARKATVTESKYYSRDSV